MPSVFADPDAADERRGERRNLTGALRRSFVKGLAILLPLVITLFVISIVFGFISRALEPMLGLLEQTHYLRPLDDGFVLLMTVAIFGIVVLLIGSVSEYGSDGNRIREQYDQFVASIPGFGRIYWSFDEMSELLLESDTDSFQNVKLVEYPGEDSYVVAFKTVDTPEVITRQTGNEDMITLFMPLAPNPVMGGFVIHVSRDRVVDVDLTVEEGIRSSVTSGVATGHRVDPPEFDARDSAVAAADAASSEDAASLEDAASSKDNPSSKDPNAAVGKSDGTERRASDGDGTGDRDLPGEW